MHCKNCTASVQEMERFKKEFFLNRTVNIVGKLGVNVCSTCDAYSVVDDVKNLDKKDEVEVSYAIDVSNKFNVFSESNLEIKSSVNNVEYCLSATVVKNFSNKETWKVREVGRQKKFLLLNKSKILVIVKNNNTFMSVLLNTGSDRCLINYRNVKCLPSDSIKESKLRVRGVNGARSVVEKLS